MHIKRSTLKNVQMYEGLSGYCNICNLKKILKECECNQFHGKFTCIASIANTWTFLYLWGKHWRSWEERRTAKHSFPAARRQMELSVIRSITTSPCCKTPQISSSPQNCMGPVSKYIEGTWHPAGTNSEDMTGFPKQSCWIPARMADFPQFVLLARSKTNDFFQQRREEARRSRSVINTPAQSSQGEHRALDIYVHSTVDVCQMHSAEGPCAYPFVHPQSAAQKQPVATHL